MDKAEYQQKLEELTECYEAKDYAAALEIADTIDWRRVKSVKTLSMVADVYERNRNYEKTKDILMIAHTRTTIGRGILSRLVEVCLRLGQVEQAEKYFREFSKVAQNDSSRCVLQYKLYQAKEAPLEAQIAVLEEYREKEYTERWAYELATLYARAGEREKCVEACDDLILWFNEGPFVLKALELKKQYEPLTDGQQILYARERDAEAKRAREAAAARAAEEAAAREAAAKAEAEEAARAEAAAQEAAAAEAEKTVEAAEEPKSLSDVSLIYGGDEPEEEEEEEEEPKESHKAAAPEDMKNRLLRSFRNVFGGSKEKDDDDIEFEDEDDEFAAGGKEPAEEDLKVRELLPDEATYKSDAEEAASQAVPVTPEPIRKEFDLDEFLSETGSSFSEELSEGSYRATTEEEPPRFDESVNTPEEEAAGGYELEKPDLTATGSMTPVESIQAVVESAEPASAPAAPEMTGSEIPKEVITETVASVFPKEAAVDVLPKEVTAEAAADVFPKEVTAEAAADVFPKEVTAEPAAEEPQPAAQAEVTAEEAIRAAVVTEEPAPVKKKPKYNEELEIPDEEPTEDEKRTHTIPLGTIGQNTVPISIDKILSSETPEEQRIRIMNRARPTRMSEEQRKVFTYFARIPGMDSQILEAISSVYEHAGERTSLHGNIGVMGAKGTGKTRLSEALVTTMCKDLGIEAAKIARISGEELNLKDPARVVNIMAGGFLMIENISLVNEQTLEKLDRAMEFRTDCMVVIVEDEKTAMRAYMKDHPVFAAKFDKLISIPVFTNDELVTFARTYAAENDCQVDDLGILALYTKIGNQQSEEKPVTISEVRDLVDKAIEHASKGRHRSKRGSGRRGETSRIMILHEKDFE